MADKENIEFKSAMDAYEDARRKRAIKALFEKNSICFEIKDFNYVTRCWAWLKTLICLLLKRTNGSYLMPDYFNILSYDEYSGYESQSWEAVWISPKFLTGWQACVSSDGT